MATITFKALWDNYPEDHPCVDDKGNIKSGYDNQCAIRLGVALAKSGVPFNSFPGGMCPGTKKEQGMSAGAQELANWLSRSKILGLGKEEVYTGQEAFEKISGRSGIVFLSHYWHRATDKEGERTGDHIDLWNGSRFTSPSSYLRVHLGISWDGWWSDYRLAKKVIFWPVP